jgi:hypothetical protein
MAGDGSPICAGRLRWCAATRGMLCSTAERAEAAGWNWIAGDAGTWPSRAPAFSRRPTRGSRHAAWPDPKPLRR